MSSISASDCAKNRLIAFSVLLQLSPWSLYISLSRSRFSLAVPSNEIFAAISNGSLKSLGEDSQNLDRTTRSRILSTEITSELTKERNLYKKRGRRGLERHN